MKVDRTRTRPLASGELSTINAVGFLAGNLLAGLCGLCTLNVECIKLGLAIMPLVIVYPVMKRFTSWPQAVLGLTFNWGVVIGWTAVQGSVSWPHVLPLYGAGVCWTLVYDTLYGHQDKRDDQLVDIKSTALLFGANTKPILAGFGVATVGLLGTAGYVTGLSWPFYAGTAVAAGHLARQISSADLEDPQNLSRIFRSNQEFGALVLASIVAGHW